MNVQLELAYANVSSLSVLRVQETLCAVCNERLGTCGCTQRVMVPSIFPRGFDLADEQLEE